MTKQQIKDKKEDEPIPEEAQDVDDDQDDEADEDQDVDDDQDDDAPTPPAKPKAKRFQDDHPPAEKRKQGRREQDTYDDVRPALRLWDW